MHQARDPHRMALLQVRALLLLAVFCGAGTTLPSLDALLYHTRSPDLEGGRVHLEPAGPCPSHSAHCSLGRVSPGSGALSGNSTTIRSEASPRASRTVAPVTPSLVSQRDHLVQPRAPPVPIA